VRLLRLGSAQIWGFNQNAHNLILRRGAELARLRVALCLI